jgi:serine/threonine protein kinase
MSLSFGARIGVYEVVRPLGAGGMGEVYLARDTVLNRHVALKVLPEAFVRDGERLARFEREAQLLASSIRGAISCPSPTDCKQQIDWPQRVNRRCRSR